MAIDVQYQPTPNPNSLKFTVNKTVVESGSASYMSAEEAQDSPLAAALFAVEGVASIFMLGNFITVNKSPEADWTEMVPQLTDVIVEKLSE